MSATSDVRPAEPKSTRETSVVLGEDWVSPDGSEVRADRFKHVRRGRGLFSFNQSPLARKIITFNLLAMVILVAGVLYLNPSRDGLVYQREISLVNEAELIADVFEAVLPQDGPVSFAADAVDPAQILGNLDLAPGLEVFLFDNEAALVATAIGAADARELANLPVDGRSTLITDFLNTVWEGLSSVFSPGGGPDVVAAGERQANALVPEALTGLTQVNTGTDPFGNTIFSVATPIVVNGESVGVVALTSAAGEIDELVSNEREQVLQMFVIAILVSIGLSLVLASTIANPLSDLAAAAEIGRDRNSRKISPSRVRIPDLTARPDEIGRLSGALRGMVAALYDRIDSNEQFAADVAHEIKNPLASLRSAIGTLRLVKKDEQRAKLLDVIEHDVRRLDRLVSDISNASRLDSELVKEDEETFNLLKMIRGLSDHLGGEARAEGIEFITDLPSEPIIIDGLESRLAQVFVNLITNAISFCEDGDAIRVWARKRDNRVLVVVEDTGPGIPESALTKVFNRFYSERPEGHFGNNSGLGLAISKQIVEAHGGVIWAENIRPTDADITSEPLGARFVVGLPV